MTNKIAAGPNDKPQTTERNLIFSIYDEKAETFSLPLTHSSVSVAIRSFTAGCKNPQSFLNQFPSDYALYLIGSFDENNAQINSYPQPRFIVRASEILNQLQEAAHAPSN